MSDSPTPAALPWDGGCRCDQLRFRISAPPVFSSACHCSGCQRMSGSAFSLTLMVPRAGFEVVAGDPVVGGLRGDDIAHRFCPSCMSWVFTEPTGFDFVNVRATLLDDARWFAPFAETYTSEGLPWARTGAEASFAHFPPMEELGGLMARHAEWASARGWPVPD